MQRSTTYSMGDDPLPLYLKNHYQEFFKVDVERTVGADIYPAIFEEPLLFPLQRMRETARMMAVARRYNPQVIFEIGTDKGGGLYHWCKCFPEVRRVIACEIRGTPYSEEFETAFPHIDFLWLQCSSYDLSTIESVKNWLCEDRIDVLFIDGDKGKFLKDFYAYKRFMRRQSVIFMHDIRDLGPSTAWREILKEGYSTEHILDTSESDEAVARANAGILSTTAYEDWLRYWKGASASVGVIYIGDKK